MKNAMLKDVFPTHFPTINNFYLICDVGDVYLFLVTLVMFCTFLSILVVI